MTTTVYTDDGEPTEQSRLLRRALCASPHDRLTWMTYFDTLEEAGQADVTGIRRWCRGAAGRSGVSGLPRSHTSGSY